MIFQLWSDRFRLFKTKNMQLWYYVTPVKQWKWSVVGMVSIGIKSYHPLKTLWVPFPLTFRLFRWVKAWKTHCPFFTWHAEKLDGDIVWKLHSNEKQSLCPGDTGTILHNYHPRLMCPHLHVDPCNVFVLMLSQDHGLKCHLHANDSHEKKIPGLASWSQRRMEAQQA